MKNLIPNSDLGPTIETAHLILRPPIMEDFDAFANMHSEEETMKFLGGVQARAVAWRTFCGFVGGWKLLGFGMFSMLDKTNGKWIGRTGPIHPIDWPGDEVGWGVIESARGKGLAIEAAIATMDFAFDILQWESAIHTIEITNKPSQILAARLGSKNLGPVTLPPPFVDFEMEAWGQSRAEWLVNRKNFG